MLGYRQKRFSSNSYSARCSIDLECAVASQIEPQNQAHALLYEWRGLCGTKLSRVCLLKHYRRWNSCCVIFVQQDYSFCFLMNPSGDDAYADACVEAGIATVAEAEWYNVNWQSLLALVVEVVDEQDDRPKRYLRYAVHPPSSSVTIVVIPLIMRRNSHTTVSIVEGVKIWFVAARVVQRGVWRCKLRDVGSIWIVIEVSAHDSQAQL